jgi:hypothetical protein
MRRLNDGGGVAGRRTSSAGTVVDGARAAGRGQGGAGRARQRRRQEGAAAAQAGTHW